MYEFFVVILSLFVFLATAASYLSATAWWIRGFDFPRIQITWLGLLALGLWWWGFDGDSTDYLWIALVLASLGCQGWRILPYTRLWSPQVRQAVNPHPDNCVSVLVANVLTPNRRAGDLLEIVRQQNPDLVLCLETDAWWQQQLASLKQGYPFCLECPQDNLYGMHLFSRLELRNAEICFLVEPDVPSMHADVVLPSGAEFALHCLHPAPPSPTENDTSVARDAELLVVGKSVAQRGGPTIVTGDLNDVAWSGTTLLFRKISRLLDPRIGRGRFSTFHAKYWAIRWPLDHLFHSSDFTLVSIQRLAYFGSDHFPILVKLHFEGHKLEKQKPEEPDAQDKKDAEEKIAEADEQYPQVLNP